MDKHVTLNNTANFSVAISVVNGDVVADIFYITEEFKQHINQLKGQAVLDLYNSMTGEGLTMEDL